METTKSRHQQPLSRRSSPGGRHRPLATLSALSVLLSALWALACGPLGEHPSVPPLSGAIQVNEPDHAVWTETLRDHGLDAVQVTLYARQQDWNSPDLILPDDTDGVVAEIRAAKAAGLGVTMVLRVALEQGLAANRHYWHGTIWPDDADVDAWFDNYRDFAVSAARLGAAEGVDLLVIGSELNSMTSTVPVDATPGLYAYFLDPEQTAAVRRRLVACADGIPQQVLAPDLVYVDGGGYETLDQLLRAQEEAARAWTRQITGADRAEAVDIDRLNARRARYDAGWRRVIADVRAAYGGPLGYAANFDQVLEVGFWDALDVIGANAYFPLSKRGQRGEALEEAMAASWIGVASMLNELADRHGGAGRVLPVMFFELGWTRKAASTVRPFSYHRVEVLETVMPDGGEELTCVHWATQPEDPFERVRALEALDRVVAQGAFPTLRGFTLWKLTTDPAHREIEPFAVVVGAAGGEEPVDEADRRFLATAARLADRLRGSATTAR